MSGRQFRLSFSFVILILFLAACRAQAPIEPAPMLTVVSPAIPTHAPTRTTPPTRTAAPAKTLPAPPAPTFTLVETSLPGPATLSGTIVLVGDGKKPWATTVELRQPGTFTLISQAKSGTDGKYHLKELLSGTYDLWVQITDKTGPVSICGDVVPQDGTWKIGIQYNESKGEILGDSSLSHAQRLADATLKPIGFYAVLPGLRVEPGKENVIDVSFLCK